MKNWKYFPRYWPFLRGIHRSPVHSPHKGRVTGSFGVCLDVHWTSGWANSRYFGDLRRHGAHCDITVMRCFVVVKSWLTGWWIHVLHLHVPTSCTCCFTSGGYDFRCISEVIPKDIKIDHFQKRKSFTSFVGCISGQNKFKFEKSFQLRRDHFVYAPCQEETPLRSNVVSYWLGACTQWSLLRPVCITWSKGSHIHGAHFTYMVDKGLWHG